MKGKPSRKLPYILIYYAKVLIWRRIRSANRRRSGLCLELEGDEVLRKSMDM